MPMVTEFTELLENCVKGICPVCDSPAEHTCSACKQVSYCNKEHQKLHWNEHKTQCRPCEVKSSDELGRYLVASRDVEPGTIILREQALVVGPKLTEAVPMCLGCNRMSPSSACPQCLWPACDVYCPGLIDPHHHAAECLILKMGRKLIAETPRYRFRYEIITPLRCLILQRRNPKKWKQFMSMKAHMDHRGPETNIYKELQDQIIRYLHDNYLSKLDAGVLPDTSPMILHHICGILDVNAMEMRIGTIELLAVYPTAYLMNHSCVPNSKHYFTDTRITVAAATDIKKDEKIYTTYTHILWGTQARRDHLKESKYFNCQCKRCADPTELGTYFSALKCLAEGSEISGQCGGLQLPVNPLDEKSNWKCNKCPVVLSSEEANDLVARLGDEVDSVQYSNPTVDHLEELLKKLQTFVHPNHFHCYTVKHSLVQVYGHQLGYLHTELSEELLNKKIALCREILSLSDTLDPTSSRLCIYIGVIIYELQTALMELASRNPELPDSLTKGTEAKSLLQHEIEILEHEPDFTPGAEMRELAKKSLPTVTKWIAKITNK